MEKSQAGCDIVEQADQRAGAQRSDVPAGTGLDLHIDELVLHGFGPGDRYAIAAAVERELGRLFTEEGVPRGLAEDRDGSDGDFETTDATRSVFRMDAGTFDVTHDATPDAVGTQVARAIHRSLGAVSVDGRGQEAGSR
jgi:hypothetical protein